MRPVDTLISAVKVASVNIRKNNAEGLLCKLLKTYDVVAMQEVSDSSITAWDQVQTLFPGSIRFRNVICK